MKYICVDCEKEFMPVDLVRVIDCHKGIYLAICGCVKVK